MIASISPIAASCQVARGVCVCLRRVRVRVTMRDELPAERLGAVTALMRASLGVGGALGLPAAALTAERADWHLLFWTSCALGAPAFALVPAQHADRNHHRRRPARRRPDPDAR
jgi:predicted MFS family arabinose efflux permease